MSPKMDNRYFIRAESKNPFSAGKNRAYVLQKLRPVLDHAAAHLRAVHLLTCGDIAAAMPAASPSAMQVS